MSGILSDIDIGIKDGGLGVVSEGDGALAVIGVCANYQDAILTLSRDSYKEAVGEGPLLDFLDDFFSMVNTVVYARILQGTTAGVVSAVAADAANSGAGGVAVAGSPANAYKFGLEIISAGGLNEATFKYSIDGIESKEITVPEAGTYAIPETGLTITFSAGEPAGEQESFDEGDLFSWETTEPLASNAEYLTAVDDLIDYGEEIRSIHVTGATAAAFWFAFATKLANAEDKHVYIWGSCEARYIDESTDETLQEYVTALVGTERGSGVSIRLMVVSMWIEVVNANTASVRTNNAAGKMLGRIYAIGRALSPGATKLGSLDSVNRIMPAEFKTNPALIKALQNAGYATVRNYDGKKGVYVYDSDLMSEDTSDFDIATKIDVMNKARNSVREAQFKYLKDDFEVLADGTVPTLDNVRKVGEQALSAMAKDKEISSGRIELDTAQDILSTKKLVEKIYITPRGSFNEISAEISYENPLSS